ncbi:hypothetical protein NQ315_000163 [Exocentrus adspersus]|uniref:SMB domain-containing protein n=1 Tax=Exocentrus adspersus TaxID=1586481 RepID=A0AAV8VRD3_9CUCU|nr:hypothetical protein NQ315_000163 [Exocentrus adspersus]
MARVPLPFQLVAFLCMFAPGVFSGSCREAKLCCAGRDSSCVVQKAPLNAIIEDLSDKPCYCDHACLKLGDCCSDFKEACGGGRLHNERSDWAEPNTEVFPSRIDRVPERNVTKLDWGSPERGLQFPRVEIVFFLVFTRRLLS